MSTLPKREEKGGERTQHKSGGARAVCWYTRCTNYRLKHPSCSSKCSFRALALFLFPWLYILRFFTEYLTTFTDPTEWTFIWNTCYISIGFFSISSSQIIKKNHVQHPLFFLKQVIGLSVLTAQIPGVRTIQHHLINDTGLYPIMSSMFS